MIVYVEIDNDNGFASQIQISVTREQYEGITKLAEQVEIAGTAVTMIVSNECPQNFKPDNIKEPDLLNWF